MLHFLAFIEIQLVRTFASSKRKMSTDKTKKIQEEIDQTKDILTENIKKVAENMDSLKVIEEKSESLQNSSKLFRNSAKSLKKLFYCRNLKLWIVGGSILLVFLTIIVLAIVFQIRRWVFWFEWNPIKSFPVTNSLEISLQPWISTGIKRWSTF